MPFGSQLIVSKGIGWPRPEAHITPYLMDISFFSDAYNIRMEDETLYDKDKFETVLKRMIEMKPIPFKEAVAKPKLKKDGTPRKARSVQKMDK